MDQSSLGQSRAAIHPRNLSLIWLWIVGCSIDSQTISARNEREKLNASLHQRRHESGIRVLGHLVDRVPGIHRLFHRLLAQEGQQRASFLLERERHAEILLQNHKQTQFAGQRCLSSILFHILWIPDGHRKPASSLYSKFTS